MTPILQMVRLREVVDLVLRGRASAGRTLTATLTCLLRTSLGENRLEAFSLFLIFKKLEKKLFIFAPSGLRCWVRAFSSCSGLGPLSSCGAQASH